MSKYKYTPLYLAMECVYETYEEAQSAADKYNETGDYYKVYKVKSAKPKKHKGWYQVESQSEDGHKVLSFHRFRYEDAAEAAKRLDGLYPSTIHKVVETPKTAPKWEGPTK